MLIPIIISSVFVLGVAILCTLKPNTGRIFLGFFYLVMAIGVNGYFTFGNPQGYVDYASEALIPMYRSIAVTVVEFNPVLFGILLMAFEIAMGLLLLYKGFAVKIGLLGTILFLVGIAPLSVLQFPWLGLIIAQAYLLTKEFKNTFFDTVRARLGSRPSDEEEKI
jgi:hypothetical protein